jgi:HEAT repeat-containing protein 5
LLYNYLLFLEVLPVDRSSIDWSHHSSSISNCVDENDDIDDVDGDEDDQQALISNKTHLIPRLSSSTQWHTKIFAITCVDNLITYCEQTTSSLSSSSLSSLHFDYIHVQEHIRTSIDADYLILHSTTLINLSLIACRSSCDQLRSSGLFLLKRLILKFSSIRKHMDVPDCSLLDEYQAHICAALRPSFSQDTTSHITTQACDVCSTWISTGVMHELPDLRRAHQLLVTSLQRLPRIQSFIHDTNRLWNEHDVIMENLAILKVWADVYNMAMSRHNEQQNHSLSTFLSLIQPELDILIHHWLAALIDYACLILPNEFGGSQGTVSSGNFYCQESNLDVVKILYKTTWPSFVRAATQWLLDHDYDFDTSNIHPKLSGHGRHDVFLTKLLTLTVTNKRRLIPEKKEDLFNVLLGDRSMTSC